MKTRMSKTAIRIVIATVAGAMLAGCASEARIRTDYDKSADFGAYQSFSWIADTALIAARDSDTPVSALNVRRIESAIERELTARGYRFSRDPARADFIVSFTVGARDRIEVESFPYAYRGRWWGVWPSYGTYVRDYQEGHLGIDIFDGQSRAPVWFGSASRNVRASDREDPQSAIDKAVALILEQFPPR